MTVYYNENNPFCAQWLRNLIAAGHLPAGDVDDRSIEDVEPADVAGYVQCHWFAGVGGWPLALRLAGVSPTAKVWTGSPPCQQNSNAAAVHGRRTGLRGHQSGLAGKWLELVAACTPPASISRTSPASSRGLPKSRAVWRALAIAWPNPNDRLRVLVHIMNAGECGLLPTVVARDYRSPGDPDHPRHLQTRGQPLPEVLGLRLPADFARWMMGFPPEWAQCMPTAMPLTRGSPRK